jgi:hypothetical protein
MARPFEKIKEVTSTLYKYNYTTNYIENPKYTRKTLSTQSMVVLKSKVRSKWKPKIQQVYLCWNREYTEKYTFVKTWVQFY